MSALSVTNRQRRHKVNTRALGRFFRRAAAEVAPADAAATLVLVGDPPMRGLNRAYRGVDSPTDVLSFAAGNGAEGGDARYLGDIVISVETARRRALRRGSNLGRELRVLALHGLLHLLGYDHETDRGEMRRLEYRMRRRFRITHARGKRP